MVHHMQTHLPDSAGCLILLNLSCNTDLMLSTSSDPSMRADCITLTVLTDVMNPRGLLLSSACLVMCCEVNLQSLYTSAGESQASESTCD